MEKNKITPSQYFEYLKDSKQTITTETLKNSYGVFIDLAQKYEKLGQAEALKRLCFLADTLRKEEKLIEIGVTTFIYKDVLEEYIEHVADKTVKIIELSRYMREIPDELVGVVEKTKDLFDQFYVVFTDYTGKEERRVEKERREKDPILFGCFKNGTSVADRFYFLGDWVDEFCDLTLDKLVVEYEKKRDGKSPSTEIKIPTTADELLLTLKSYKIKEGGSQVTLIHNDDLPTSVAVNTPLFAYETPTKEQKPGFFDKVRSVFKKN